MKAAWRCTTDIAKSRHFCVPDHHMITRILDIRSSLGSALRMERTILYGVSYLKFMKGMICHWKERV